MTVVGHGFRARTVEGPPAPGEDPELTEIRARRYACRACDATLVVVPAGVARGYRYSLSAIAWALALWAYERATPRSVRERTSKAKVIGYSRPTGWASLRRWTRCALALFGVAPSQVGTMRERATEIVCFIASHALHTAGPVPIDAFFGASFCRPS